MKRKTSEKGAEHKQILPSKRVQGKKNKENGGKEKWNEVGAMMYCDFESTPSAKVLGFDMDGTLIATKSGRAFPVDDSDWQLLYPNIPQVLQRFQAEGYRIVIFTNQKGIKQGKQDKGGMKKKIQSLMSVLGVNALVMVSCGDDEFRKPCTGMWDYLAQHLNGDLAIDKSLSKYIGDAAGRPANSTRKKKDFNDTDLKYSLNIGVKFETPEKCFLGQRDKLPAPRVDPRIIKRTGVALKGAQNNSEIARSTTEVIIFVGSPGSGKSTFWKNYLSTYTRVNNDTLKTKERCLRAMRTSLEANKSCVIDNTNPTAAVRSAYIEIAKEFNVPVRAFVFKMPKDMAFHLDTLRRVNTHRKHISQRVGSIPIHKFYKDFELPSISEGISEIQEVELIGGPFDNPEDERIFYSFV